MGFDAVVKPVAAIRGDLFMVEISRVRTRIQKGVVSWFIKQLIWSEPL